MQPTHSKIDNCLLQWQIHWCGELTSRDTFPKISGCFINSYAYTRMYTRMYVNVSEYVAMWLWVFLIDKYFESKNKSHVWNNTKMFGKTFLRPFGYRTMLSKNFKFISISLFLWKSICIRISYYMPICLSYIYIGMYVCMYACICV